MYTDTYHIDFDGKACQLQILQQGLATWFLIKHEGKMLARIFLNDKAEWVSFPKLTESQMTEILEVIKRLYE